MAVPRQPRSGSPLAHETCSTPGRRERARLNVRSSASWPMWRSSWARSISFLEVASTNTPSHSPPCIEQWRYPMVSETIRLSSDPDLWTDRQGTAMYTRLAFAGTDMMPHWKRLVADITDDAKGAAIGVDLSIISQLMGDQKTGLAIQADSLRYQQLFRSPCSAKSPKLRVLALAAQMDIGGNTPIEFLLEGSDVELITLYVVPGAPLPNPLPDHDVAIVLAPDDAKSRDTLAMIDRLAPHWPRPMLNLPKHILGLDRHTLCELLSPVPGLERPRTSFISRERLIDLSLDACCLTDMLDDGAFPIIVRPIGSHAGLGLEKLEDAAAIAAYLET